MVNAISSTQSASALATNSSSQVSDILICESCDSRSKYYGKFTDKQISEAWDRVSAREFAAFVCLANDASSGGIKKYAEAYLNYVNQLSPEEQNSVRYKGTKESMTALLAQVNTQINNDNSASGKKSKEAVSDIVKMFEEVMARFKKINKQAASSASDTDTVTISEEAARYAASIESKDSTES